jgi:hypothetical protein
MELRLYKTLWGHTGTLGQAMDAARTHGFDGLEGQPPASAALRRDFCARLKDAGLDYIAEICTAGSYVPERRASLADHLASFQHHAEAAMECAPRFLTVIGGCDAWPMEMSAAFFSTAIETAKSLGVTACFETHRSRSLFNPWITRDLLAAVPELQLTCDFSHWCCVCERLVDTEPEVLALCAERVHHIHARVGYAQGPQVPHPAAPEYQSELAAHEGWWAQLWRTQKERGARTVTMTPEFGPDGYLQSAPFTQIPVADLDEINLWMANRLRGRFTALP